MQTFANREIFNVNLPSTAPIPQKMRPMAQRAIKRVLSLKKLEDIYRSIPSDLSLKDYLIQARRELKTCCQVEYLKNAQIPKHGPCVMVANHPFGGIEGLIIAEVILGIRNDVRIMANYLLKSIPKLQDLFIFVDPFEKSTSIEKNLRPLREAIRWVKNGGFLVVFPSGEVSHLKLQSGTIEDPQWNPTVARIATHSKSAVIPAFFHGRNGALFQTMGLIHPRLRTAMLPRQLLKSPQKGIKLTIGEQIPLRKLRQFKTPYEITEYLRWRTYLLPTNLKQQILWNKPANFSIPTNDSNKKLAPRFIVQREIENLITDNTLACAGNLKVIRFYKKQAPFLMKQIAEKRESTFRQIGEGTGQEIDLDKFDDYYLQLCLWDVKNKQIAGGYRIGFTDQIIPRYGIGGLYTSTLFKYKPAMFTLLNQAIELGRSFVVPEYQKSYSALLLLWKAIGRILILNPKYHYILGPVSISNNYHKLSKKLIADFFANHLKSDFANLVRPKNPMHFNRQDKKATDKLSNKIKTIDDLSQIVADIEGDKRGVPILLQQYVKLASKAAAWNLDPGFGDVLDCLLISDLNQADPKILSRYCG